MSRKLKYIYDADTSGFQKGTKQVKAGLKDLDKTGKEALGSLGDLFGVNSAKVQQLTGAIGGLGTRLSKSASEGTAAFGKLLQGISKAGAAVAGLGLAAAVAGWKALNAEADNFFTTVEGARLKAGLDAYTQTYKQAMHDINSETGRSVAETMSEWKRFWGRFKADLGVFIISGGLAPGLSGMEASRRALSGSDTAREMAIEAERYGQRAYDIQRELSDLTVKQAAIDAEIAKQRLIAYDNTYSTAEQLRAIVTMQELIRKKYSEQLPLERELADIMYDVNDLASSTPQQIDAANAQAAKAVRLQAQQDQELSALLRRYNSILGAQEQITLEWDKTTDAIIEARAALQDYLLLSGGEDLPDLTEGAGAKADSEPGIQRLNSYYSGVQQVYSGLIDGAKMAQSAIEELAISGAESFGELIAAAVKGGDAWTNFGNNALSSLADVAISVGRITMGTGLASMEIIKSLALEPWMAVGVGAALVALGTAVKSSLSSVASGSYSSGSMVASSAGYTSGGGNSSGIQSREIVVKVEGQLKASGGDLVAAIGGYENKRRITT